MNNSSFECTCDSEGVNNTTGKCISCGKLYLKGSSEIYKQLVRLKHNVCPICCAKPTIEQPQAGLHGYTIVFECGCKVDRPISGEGFSFSQRCDEPIKPSLEEVFKLSKKKEEKCNCPSCERSRTFKRYIQEVPSAEAKEWFSGLLDYIYELELDNDCQKNYLDNLKKLHPDIFKKVRTLESI